jgi:hypothetical protein
MPTGSYDPYHLGDTGHTTATRGAGAYLGWWLESHQAHGLFPQTQSELDGMWASKIGVTCIETFFYISRFDNSGTNYQFAVDIRQQSNSKICGYQLRLRNNNALRIRFGYVRGNTGTNGWSGNVALETADVNNWMSPDEWYHSVLRYNSTDSQWEWLVGRLGKNSDGTDAGGTVDSLNGTFWGPQEGDTTHTPGKYFRMIRGETDPANGPILVFIHRQLDNNDNSMLGTSGLAGFFGTQQNNSPSSKLNRSWPGGHCEHRFWKSDMASVINYGKLESLKTVPVDGDQHADLVHCFRLNETGASLSVADYEDVGVLNGTFESAVSNISSTSPDSGYPYDIVGQGPSGPTDHKVSATIAGQSTIYDFYGRPFGVDGDGNTVYREKLFIAERSINSQLDVNGDLDQLQADGLRIAVTDYYNGKTYLLPGLATINEDTEDGSDFYLSLSGTFICNSGQDVVFSNYYLVENDPLYEVDPANNLPSVSYYLSTNQGPSHYVGSETGNIFVGVTLD